MESEEKKYSQIFIYDGQRQEFFIEKMNTVTKECGAWYHLMILIQRLRGIDIGDSFLKKYWKNDYENKIKQLNKFIEAVSKMNFYFEGINERTKDIKEISNDKILKAKRYFTDACKLSLIAFEAYGILLNNSNLRGLAIPNEYLVKWGLYTSKRRLGGQIWKEPTIEENFEEAKKIDENY